MIGLRVALTVHGLVDEISGSEEMRVELPADQDEVGLGEGNRARLGFEGLEAGLRGLVHIPAGVASAVLQGLLFGFGEETEREQGVVLGETEGVPDRSYVRKGDVPAPQVPERSPAARHGVVVRHASRRYQKPAFSYQIEGVALYRLGPDFIVMFHHCLPVFFVCHSRRIRPRGKKR